MSRRVLVTLVATVVTWLAVPAVPVAASPAATWSAVDAVAVQPGEVTPPTVPVDEAVDNPFIPEGRDLSECISAVPKPGCGSTARGGWRQGLVFGVMVAGLAVIGWQVTRTVRRARQAVEGNEGADRADDKEPAAHRGP